MFYSCTYISPSSFSLTIISTLFRPFLLHRFPLFIQHIIYFIFRFLRIFLFPILLEIHNYASLLTYPAVCLPSTILLTSLFTHTSLSTLDLFIRFCFPFTYFQVTIVFLHDCVSSILYLLSLFPYLLSFFLPL